MSISERLYIRWFPDEASEPTSTLVLTTPSRHFVDLRFYKPSPESKLTEPSLTALEWGFSGRSVGTGTHGKWIHEISSRTDHPDGEADEGDMFPHPTLPDVELERGRMAHPESGEVREYEEAWKAIPVLAVGDSHQDERLAVRLETRSESGEKTGVRGAIVRVGQYCQGIVREGGKVTVQRWAWAQDGGWKQIGRVGNADIPCGATWANVKEGDAVQRGGVVWVVKEVTRL
ncbi:hypothetical protein C8Q77DRAFT_1074447 [Trametes polyzona]|nr:hypothetical protein C8Q77DRAFT_1074447 [Trametes polyzona]